MTLKESLVTVIIYAHTGPPLTSASLALSCRNASVEDAAKYGKRKAISVKIASSDRSPGYQSVGKETTDVRKT